MRLRLLLFAIFLAAHNAGAAWWEPSLDGAVGGALEWGEDRGRDDPLARVRLRPGLRGGDDGDLYWQAAYEVATAWGEGAAVSLGRTPKLRIADLDEEISSGPHHAASQNLDRLYAEYRLGGPVATVGRQAVGHGSGRFFNPSDIFAPLNPAATWSEHKSGVDGARLAVPVGEDTEWELYLFAHEDGADDSYYLARGRAALGGLDVAAYAGSTLDAPTVAADVALDWLGAGWYAEGVARFDRSPGETLRATVGAHHRFPAEVDVFAEFHFNGPGQDEPEDYWQTLGSRAWDNGEIASLGRFYFAVGADYIVNPAVVVAASTVVNLSDSSVLVLPLVEWVAGDYFSVTLGGSLGFGPSAGAGSEYGSVPDFIFAEGRVNL